LWAAFGCLLLLLSYPVLRAAAAEAGPYESALRKADVHMKRGEFVEALSVAQEAIKLDERRFEGHHSAALALYYQESVDQAARYAQAAMARAPEDQRAMVERLIDAIGKKRTYWERVRAGDQAVAKGYTTKAAAEYTEAWRAMPARAEVGLKAARLWEQIQEFTEGAKILRAVAKQAKEPAVVRGAQRLLAAWKGPLEKLGWEKWREGYELYGRWDEADRYQFHHGQDPSGGESVDLARRAVSALTLAFDALQNPGYAVSAAAVLVREKKEDEAVVLLERGATEAGLKAEEIFGEPRLRRLAGHEKFKKFLERTYGSTATAMAAEIHRELSDLSGKWDLWAGPFPFGPVQVAQHGSEVVVTFEKNDNVNYPGAKAGNQQFEGARRGQRLAGFLALYGERRDCAKETTKVKAELVLSDDGLEMVSLPPRHYLSGRGQGAGNACMVKAEDNDYYYWTRDTAR
jgi:tetratricopeptide (TPR) repeat protein